MEFSQPYFEETQWLRQTRWIWYIVILNGLAFAVPILYMIYWQLIRHEHHDRTPIGDDKILLIAVLLVVFQGIMIAIIRIIKLRVLIDKDGVHYNFFPSTRGWKTMRRQDILAYEIKKKTWIDQLKRGYHSNRLMKTRHLQITGDYHIKFQLANKWKIYVGTQRIGDFERAVQRMMSVHQNV
jgi:hypothetical protein